MKRSTALDSSIFGHGDFGRLTFTLNGTYLSRFEFQATHLANELGSPVMFVPPSPRLLVRCHIIELLSARSMMARLILGSLVSISGRPSITPANTRMTISS